MNDTDIMARLNRILSAADERGLDETECRVMRDAICEIGQLLQERDEVRREFCKMRALDLGGTMTPHKYAELSNWNCFRDSTNT